MSLSKQQMIGVVGAGIFVVCAGGLGWMLYATWSEKVDAEEQVAAETDVFRRFNEAAVFPSKASIDSVKSNETSYAEWHDSAVALAARGDRATRMESASKFKQLLEREVRRIRELPGGAGGKISAPSFLFGFEQYLGEGGVLPKDSDVPRLAVQLGSICRLVDAFAEVGVYEVKSVRRLMEKAEKQEDEDSGPPSSGKSRRHSAKKEADDAPKVTKESYAFGLLVRPSAVVALLNRLTSCQRFVVVRELSLKQSVDGIVTRITAAKTAEDGNNPLRSATRRRGRVPMPQEVNPAAVALANRIVSDPEGDEPLEMSFTLDVYDFGRSASAPAAAENVPAADSAVSAKPPSAAEKADGGRDSRPASPQPAEKPAEEKAEKGDFE